MRTEPLGTVLVVSSFTLVLAGVLFQSLSFVLAGIVFAGMLVYARLRFVEEIRSTRLMVTRSTLEEVPFAGEPTAISLEIINVGPVPLRGHVEDIIPEGCELASGLNRLVGTVPPRSQAVITYTIRPSRRGSFTFEGLKLLREDVFGLFSSEESFPRKTVLVVHTTKESLHTAKKLAGREHLEYSGVARSVALVMRSLEFDKIRDYVPGDRARDIHWKLYSKLGKLMTKEYVKEGAVQTMVFLDCSRSMRVSYDGRSKLDHAVDLSMQLSSVLLSSFHPVGAALIDEVSVLEDVKPGLGRGQFDRIVRLLRNAPEAVKAPAVPEPAPPPRAASESMLGKEQLASEEEDAFMEAVRSLGPEEYSRPRATGMDSLMRSSVSRSKGQKLLFIVISDLVSSRESVATGARLCQRTGNRMVVLHTYDDWYSAHTKGLDVAEAERLYGNIAASVKDEAFLKALGAAYLRVGPADTTAGIVRTLRRGES